MLIAFGIFPEIGKPGFFEITYVFFTTLKIEGSGGTR